MHPGQERFENPEPYRELLGGLVREMERAGRVPEETDALPVNRALDDETGPLGLREQETPKVAGRADATAPPPRREAPRQRRQVARRLLRDLELVRY